MARIQLVMGEEDRERFVEQAKKEGMSLNAWMHAAGMERIKRQRDTEAFRTLEDVEEFFRKCDLLHGREKEPDWEEHLKVLNESKSRGATGT